MNEDEEKKERLERLLKTVRRDNEDGMTAYVDFVDEEANELIVLSSDGDEDRWDPADFEGTYNEHLVGQDEVWRCLRGTDQTRLNPTFAGADARVIALTPTHVTYKMIYIPLAADSKKACRLKAQETQPLTTFLQSYDLVADSIDEYEEEDGDGNPVVLKYEPTDADREGHRKASEEIKAALKSGEAPEDKVLADTTVALGLCTQAEMDAGRALAKKRGSGLKGLIEEITKMMAPPPPPVPGGVVRKEDQEVAAALGGAEFMRDTDDNDTRGDDTMSEQQQGSKKTANDFKDVKLVRAGHQVILPEGMTTRVGIEWLTRIDKEDERTVRLSHEIQAYPIEGAYALYRALNEKYGFVSLQGTPGFFGETPPSMVGLDISRTEHVQVPWGRIAIPGVSGFLETGIAFKPDGSVRFTLKGEVKRRDEEEANALVELVRDFATTRSIYKGKAIRVRFPENPEAFDPAYVPEFIDTSKVREQELVFPKDVAELVDVTLFSPIEKTKLCRALQIPLKRGILLEGPFGVGKTLTAYVTAKKCEENGWTFMYVDKTADLKKAIMLARNYQPCAIFAEDIDRALDGEERDEAMDEILNTIDGIDGKSSEIIVVLTTNNVEKINRAMLRPGRLDAVIPVRAPDAGAAIQLVRNYSRGLLKATEEEMVPVGEALQGLIPASIREAVERAKLAAIVRLPKDATELDLRPEDLIRANTSMQTQLKLMEQPIEDERSPIEKGMAVLAEAVKDTFGKPETSPKPNGESKRHDLVSGVEA